ncbi:MAG: hypothetical protein LQ352_002724 [Teloschistes flavicans]|nr:MAG: hypothetical protein LQ352_002724 [Teloschistes flavicans]
MYFATSLTSTLLLAGGALAQYGSGSGSSYGSGSGGSGSMDSGSGSSSMMPSSSMGSASAPMSTGTPSGPVRVHVVKVSNKKGDLIFEPNNMQAAPGEMVQFHFYPKNHSVVQSTFDQPCQPIKNNMPSATGFFSGFMPVKANASMMPSYTIMVNDTKPIWYYCSQGDHCQDGMVGVINPPAANQSRTIESFTALAKQATENLSPGQSSSMGSTGASSYSSPGSSSAPIPSDSGSSSTVTMPLSGTNSSSTTSGAASPSGSAGGQSPKPFAGGANTIASKVSLFSSLAFAGAVGFVITAFL